MGIDFRDEWLIKLAAMCGIPTLEFDSAGICQLTLDSEFILTIHKDPHYPKIILFGQFPALNLNYELVEDMLRMNRLHALKPAPVISLSEDDTAIEVHFKLDQAELDSSENIVHTMLATLEYWKARCRY